MQDFVIKYEKKHQKKKKLITFKKMCTFISFIDTLNVIHFPMYINYL